MNENSTVEETRPATTHNAAVRSRQVVRRMAFFVALADVNQRFGGEPRAARRRMARRLAKAATKGLR